MSKRTSAQPPKYDPSAPRTSRREQLRQERRRRSLTWNIIVLGTGIIFLLAIGAFVFLNQRPGPLPGEQAIQDDGAAVYPAGQTITYRHYPPSSGGHYADPAPWGFSDALVPEGTYLANLARGGIVLLYYCPTACDALETQLRDYASRVPQVSRYNMGRLLVTRYERALETPLVAIAWDHQLNLTQFDEDLITRWYKRFVDQGPTVQP